MAVRRGPQQVDTNEKKENDEVRPVFIVSKEFFTHEPQLCQLGKHSLVSYLINYESSVPFHHGVTVTALNMEDIPGQGISRCRDKKYEYRLGSYFSS